MVEEWPSLCETAKTLSNKRSADFNLPDSGLFSIQYRLATGQHLIGYVLAFAITAAMLARIDVSEFKQKAVEPSFTEKVA